MQALLKSGFTLLQNEPLSKHTTLGIGGPADWYAEPSTVAQLAAVVAAARKENLPLFFLGGGSNLLVSDQGIEGVTLRLRGDFESVKIQDSQVRAGAGVYLPVLVRQCAELGLGGAEPLVGVPGTVGGSVIMNAGTRDLEIGAIVKSVEILSDSGALETVPAEKIKFSYRASSLAGKMVCFATLELRPGSKDSIIQTIQKYLSHRLKTQPIGTLNVGSVFRNPDNDFAARLIEAAGLKGLSRGRVQVSPKHANFMLNVGGATAEEYRALILEVQETVYKKFGVRLEPEVKMVGRGWPQGKH